MNLPMPSSARPSSSGAGHTPPLDLSLSLRTVESTGPLSPSEKESTQQKRARLLRVVPTRQLTRTLIELTNDEPEDEEEEEEEELDDTPVPTLSYNMTSAARSEYFASVAANMSSKMAMLAKNGRRSTGLIRGGPSLPRPGQLQPPAAPSSNTTPVRERPSQPKTGSRESSAGPTPAQPTSTRMSVDPMSANQQGAAAAVSAAVTITEASAPAALRKPVSLQVQISEDPRSRSGSAPPPRLPLTESPATPISMGRRTGRNARAIIVVDEDTAPAPVAQSAEVKAFNPEGKKIEIIGELGKGATSSVFKGSIDGELVALKQINVSNVKNVKAMRTALKAEVDTMKQMNHPNILKYYAIFYSRVNQEINIVLEFVEGLVGQKLISKNGNFLKEPIAAQITAQTLSALVFLKRKLIIHRDVKPDNLIISSDGVVKLIDFGTCARLQSGSSHRNSTVGTPWYVAPEVINGEDYSFSADIWSVGCSIIEYATGKPPFHDSNSVAALFKMVEGEHPPFPPVSENFTSVCKTFVQACWNRDFKNRITAEDALEHPYIKKKASVKELAELVQATLARSKASAEEEFVL
jgi:predicted Ser/Thr protein kinase